MRDKRPNQRRSIPTQQSLTRTVFWTFWFLTVALMTHAACVEFLGVGWWLRDYSWPERGLYAEIKVASRLGSFTVPCLSVVTILMVHWSWRLCLLGTVTVSLWLFYFSPRI